MKKGLPILIGGLLFLPGLLAHAAGTELSLTCTTRDLPAGAQVWLQVEPEHYQTPAPTPASLGEESSAPQQASGDSIWQFEVPASGSAPPSTHKFTFPTKLEPTSAKSVSSIRLKIRFKVDAPGRQGAYGEVIEATLGMPVLANSLPLSRCVRLREEDSDKLILESAPACSDSSFASVRRNGRILVRQPRH